MIRLYDILKEITEENKNILTRRSEGGTGTLILIPGAGGDGKRDFSTLVNTLGETFTVYTADFANELDVRKYANDIANEIENNPKIKNFALGGYSIGGAMAWHLASNLKDSKKFNKKLFWIDSGVSDSTESFIDNMVKINKPRIAIAQPLSVFKKNRHGDNLSSAEEKNILNFYSSSELQDFKNKNQGNYIEYIGSKFPPANDNDLDKDAEGKKDPWIIEDKYDKTNFDVRYSVKSKKINGMSFEEGDPIDYKEFAQKDTAQKKGLGRETNKIGKKLPSLSGVKIISIVAGKTKEGPEKNKDEEEKNALTQIKNATDGGGTAIVIPNVTHADIVRSPELANVIVTNY